MEDNYNYDNLNPKTHMIVSSSFDNLMKYNPPCAECLIQTTCIKEDTYLDLPPFLIIKVCRRLIEFLIDDDNIVESKEEFKKLLEIIKCRKYYTSLNIKTKE